MEMSIKTSTNADTSILKCFIGADLLTSGRTRTYMPDCMVLQGSVLGKLKFIAHYSRDFLSLSEKYPAWRVTKSFHSQSKSTWVIKKTDKFEPVQCTWRTSSEGVSNRCNINQNIIIIIITIIIIHS